MILESTKTFGKVLEMNVLEALALQKALTEAIRRTIATKGMDSAEEVGPLTIALDKTLLPSSLTVIVRKS